MADAYRDLLEKLDPEKYRVALLFNPFLNGVEMLQALLSEFGLGDVSTTSRKELLDRLNTYLLQQLANGRTCIAIFDEAQLPDNLQSWIAVNKERAAKLPVINDTEEPLPTAAARKKELGFG